MAVKTERELRKKHLSDIQAGCWLNCESLLAPLQAEIHSSTRPTFLWAGLSLA